MKTLFFILLSSFALNYSMAQDVVKKKNLIHSNTDNINLASIHQTLQDLTAQSDLQIAQNYVNNYFSNKNLFLKSPLNFKEMKDIDFKVDNPGKTIGLYNSDNRTVYINSYNSLSKQNLIVFGQPFNREFYTSYLVHEISHAYIRDNWKLKTLQITVQEYLAYSIQLQYLSPTTRNKIFSDNPVQEGAQLEDIIQMHDYNPFRFGMYSYHHFIAQKPDYIYDFLAQKKQ